MILLPHDFESCASANSAIAPNYSRYARKVLPLETTYAPACRQAGLPIPPPRLEFRKTIDFKSSDYSQTISCFAGVPMTAAPEFAPCRSQTPPPRLVLNNFISLLQKLQSLLVKEG